MSEPDDRSRSFQRVLWRCRRGTRELDLVLDRFARARYRDMDAGERRLFDALLEQQDTHLIEWLVYREPADNRFAPLVAAILEVSDAATPSPG